MRALRGGIPRAFASHLTPGAYAYRRYCVAKLRRLGSLPDDARPWLKEAGRLTVALDQLHAEAEALNAALANGAGRLARDKARVQLRQIERRSGRLRGQLASAEARLEELVASKVSGHEALQAYIREKYGQRDG